MKFDLNSSINILSRTPIVLDHLLRDIPDSFGLNNEGPNTWSAYDVVGHLVHGEKTDRINRLNIILEQGENRTFEPFDRFAQEKSSVGKSMSDLLDEFSLLRKGNLEILNSKNITKEMLALKGTHPALGEVCLSELLSTWTVHDLGHIAQINRVMAHQYGNEVGPWREYLRIVD